MRRVREIADSMITAGANADTVERAYTMLATGDMSALRRTTGGGGSRGFQTRPGESYPAGAGAGGGESAADVRDVTRDITRALRSFTRTLRSGYNPIGSGFGGSPPRHAEPGDYTVSTTVNGRTLTQRLRVIER
jgi:hypothetical protein